MRIIQTLSYFPLSLRKVLRNQIMNINNSTSLLGRIISLGTNYVDSEDKIYIRQVNTNGLFFFIFDLTLATIFQFYYEDAHLAAGLLTAGILFLLGSIGLNALKLTTLSRLSTASIGSFLVAYCAFYLGPDSFIAASLLLGAIFPFVYFSLKDYVSILICLIIPFLIYLVLVFTNYNYGPKIIYSSESILIITKLLMFLVPYLGILMNSWVAVSEREKKNLELAKSKKLIESIFFALSHDLANPIQNMSLITRKNLTAADFNDDRIKSFKNATNQMIRIFNNLKDVVKTSIDGKSNIPNQVLNVNELIKEALLVTDDSQKGKNVFVTYEENKESLDLKVAVIKDIFIFQVLVNFLTNSIKFSEEGDQIQITVSKNKDNMVCINIRDHGVGIEKDKIKKLFDWKERTSTIGTKGEKGTGLGLPLANMFIKQFGGHLTVESFPKQSFPKSQQGTLFSIVLPAA